MLGSQGSGRQPHPVNVGSSQQAQQDAPPPGGYTERRPHWSTQPPATGILTPAAPRSGVVCGEEAEAQANSLPSPWPRLDHGWTSAVALPFWGFPGQEADQQQYCGVHCVQ